MGSLGYNIPSSPVRVAIDRGGTFTDVIVLYADGRERAFKLLSRDPSNYRDAPIEALRRILEEVDGQSIPKGVPLDLTSIAKDLLKIGNQSRPDMFALNVQRPELLYTKVVEVPERVTLYDSTAYKRGDKDEPINGSTKPVEDNVRTGISGERVRVIEPLDMGQMRAALQQTFDEGFRSIAICLLHSYTFPDHELAIAQAAREIGFTQVSASSELSPAIRMLPRASSAVTDAYLTPEIMAYLEGFQSGVDRKSLESVNWRIMQSDGGLVHPKKLSGLRALLSGPAGGVIGYAKTSYIPEKPVPVIGFDMGGTSTDVSRYAGALEHVFESTTAGISVQAPQLDINTVAAGGGSVLSWRKGILTVGPDSAGSHPGPACYRKGGPATVTDANLILGRILPEYFPSIFGENQDQPLDVEASYQRMAELAEEINRDQGTHLSVQEAAQGFITVANEAMCRPIRALTEARGHNTADHNLAAFGGAGGQHACDIARALKIKRVILHKYSSVLSAYGIALAETVQEERLPFAEVLSASSLDRVTPILEDLRTKTMASLKQMDPICKSISSKYFLNLRYDGSDTSLMVEKPTDSWDFEDAFVRIHYQEFGFTPERDILIDDVRVRSTATTADQDKVGLRELDSLEQTRPAISDQTTPMFFEGLGTIDAPLFHLDRLSFGDTITGPAMVIDKTQSIVVAPMSTATALSSMLVIDVDPLEAKTAPKVDPIRLSVFANRFMGIAEQMGRALQKTSVSTNIKERLDFSCAIFSADGGLVANAPHVPAMLGSMSFAVKWQIQHWNGNIKKGDVFLSNAPYAGGVHLPDLTVITPVFDDNENILFWTASRGHHADVGGIVPGSMPATSTELWEEGAVIDAMKVVEDGVFHEDRVLEAMLYAPARYPGCQGARCIQDNLTDIKAQAAANQKGVNLINSLIEEFTLDVVTLYMDEVQKASENAVRDTLKTICKEKGRTFFEAEDFMDDGSRIKLTIAVNPDTGSAKFDFTGTSPQAYGNWNAPIAICNSATIYTLRCLVNAEVPLNQGCLLPIDLIIPDDSFLSPSPEAAVAAGNGLTNQRLVDAILKAFEVCAASNGCMANFTFGLATEDGFGYYETIAGGSGAGPSWHGEDGVHCHMTNTRITDPEILERRYPVLLRQFGLRQGSGGRGKFSGGEGIVRELEYLIDMHAGILSERRAFQPYGMAGGEPAARGENLWIRKNGRVINVGGKAACRVQAGDRMRILTPGGGGYGSVGDSKEAMSNGNGLKFVPLANGFGHGLRNTDNLRNPAYHDPATHSPSPMAPPSRSRRMSSNSDTRDRAKAPLASNAQVLARASSVPNGAWIVASRTIIREEATRRRPAPRTQLSPFNAPFAQSQPSYANNHALANTITRTPHGPDQAEVSPGSTIPADSSLSSSHTFGSKVQDLLGHQQQAGPPNHFSPASSSTQPLRGESIEIPKLPAEQDARRLLEAVVFYIGQTQYHFDAREISDRITYFSAKSHEVTHLRTPAFLETILVVAIGRLFLGEFDEGSYPGAGLFAFAQRNVPHLGELCDLGRLGIELLALVAVYLQNSNREKEAYIYISTALRLAISHGFHRVSGVEHYTHSERVHLNRLWWTIYMQERRLAAATGNPSGINDEVIELDLPTNSPGFSPAAPLCTNIKIGRVTGRIINVIYGKNPQSEQTFVSSVQEIVQAISDISQDIPSELEPERYHSSSELSLRTVASLHFMLCQATLLTIRPIMLHVAKLILSGNGTSGERLSSSPLGKLCRTCSEAARRLLKVIVMLREKDMLVIFGFIDFDATFSAAFIMILSAIFDSACKGEERINPTPGLDDALDTLRFLVKRGNSIAFQRLQEVQRLWGVMQSLLQSLESNNAGQPPLADQPQDPEIDVEVPLSDNTLWDISNIWFPQLDSAPVGGMSEEDQGYYFSLYNNPDWVLTGEDMTDFAEFERHLANLRGGQDS
ncbi:hypothetical protein FDECE_697 [Fusarium decemcellulare]|nr:hypothetical protein FDECE_697 [Fusarium decemcellulare]